jgi:hypothetical protein
MIPPDPRHALMEQLRALKFPNSHHGAGPHCTCSQDERERSADVLRILLDRLLVASPAPQPDDALAFQRQRADKWVDIATQRSLEIEDLKGEIERLQEGAASPVPQPEFDDHHGPFCDVTCPCGRGNVAASPAPHPNDPDVETRLRESLGALEHPSANEIAVELKVTADKDFGLIYYVRRGDVLHWFVREVKPLLAGAASPAPPAPPPQEETEDDQARVAPLKAGVDGQDLPQSDNGEKSPPFQSCRCPAAAGEDCPLTPEECNARTADYIGLPWFGARLRRVWEGFVSESQNGVVCSIPDTGLNTPAHRTWCLRCQRRYMELKALVEMLGSHETP